jgi:hypothetical protein
MSSIAGHAEFDVKIMVHIAGPVRQRSKYKKHKLLRAEGSINLPFAPYPGLYLTFSKPRKRGEPTTLYLRVRAVEWNVFDRQFECVADEMLMSPMFSELHEVRDGARIEMHFVGLQKTLSGFGFDVITNADGQMALDKCADGTLIESH